MIYVNHETATAVMTNTTANNNSLHVLNESYVVDYK